jgi:hypothetical protein
MIISVEKQYVENEFTSYKMILDNGKEWSVPLDEANTDYQEIQEWISLGNTVIDNPPEETP